MKRSKLLSGAVAVVMGLGLLAVTGRAWAQSSSHTSSHTKTKTKTESYMVVELGGQYKVISASTLKDEKKRVEEDNKKAIELWQDEVKAGSKTEAPVKKKLIVKKAGFKTQKGADEYVQVLKEKDQEEGKESTEGKPGVNPAAKKPVF
ncbi:MAG: hypothetical protein ABSG86_03605 [Thermoguttaceae bacterium]